MSLIIRHSYKENSETLICPVELELVWIGRFRARPPDDEHPYLDFDRDNQIWRLDLPDSKVSRSHARLSYDLGTWWVEDIHSHSGTRYEGNKISEKISLVSGAELRLGNTLLRLEFKGIEEEYFDPEEGVIQTESLVAETQPTSSVSETERIDILASLHMISERRQGQDMLNYFVKEMLVRFPVAERAGIVLYQDKQLIPIAFSPIQRSSVSFSLARRAILEQKAFLWQRNSASCSSQRAGSLEGITSAIYTPIIRDRQPRGALYADTAVVDSDFNQQHVDHLTEVATIIGRKVELTGNSILQTVPSVFISFSHTDTNFVKKMAGDLRRELISVWFDERLRAGVEWQPQLKAAIAATDAFVLVISPSSMESEWVKWEINHAQHIHKRIFPLLYRQSQIPSDLSDIQYIRVDHDYKTGLFELISELRGL